MSRAAGVWDAMDLCVKGAGRRDHK